MALLLLALLVFLTACQGESRAQQTQSAVPAAATSADETVVSSTYLDRRRAREKEGVPFLIVEAWTTRFETTKGVTSIGSKLESAEIMPAIRGTIDKKQIHFDEAVDILKKESQFEIEVRADTSGKKVDLIASKESLYDVLDRLCQSAGLVWWTERKLHIVIDDAAPYTEWLQPQFKEAVDRLATKCDFDATETPDGGIRLKPKPEVLPVHGGPPKWAALFGDQMKPSDPASDPRISLKIEKGTIEDFAKALSEQLGKPVRIHGKTGTWRADADYQNQPLTTVLDNSENSGFPWWENGRGEFFLAYSGLFANTIPNQPELEKGLDLISQSHRAYWTKETNLNDVSYEIRRKKSASKPTAVRGGTGNAQ